MRLLETLSRYVLLRNMTENKPDRQMIGMMHKMNQISLFLFAFSMLLIISRILRHFLLSNVPSVP